MKYVDDEKVQDSMKKGEKAPITHFFNFKNSPLQSVRYLIFALLEAAVPSSR